MRKCLTLLLILGLTVSLMACGSTTQTEDVVTSETTVSEEQESTPEVEAAPEVVPETQETEALETTEEQTQAEETDAEEVEAEETTTYTFTDMDATKYAKSSVNVRSLPNSSGDKLGRLSTNDEVHVTGQCNETGWYRIDYSGSTGYVSDSYLVDEKVTETQTTTTTPAAESSTKSCPYTLWTIAYDNRGLPYFYSRWYSNWSQAPAEDNAKLDSLQDQCADYVRDNTDYTSCAVSWKGIGEYADGKVEVWYIVTPDHPEWTTDAEGNHIHDDTMPGCFGISTAY